MKRVIPALSLVVSLCVSALVAQAPAENIDYAAIAQIRDEGLNRSQVMDHISWLSDVYGPRLTGGPGIMQASDWAIRKFNEWGLANAHRETWPFGKGWSLVRFGALMVEPQIQPLIGFPGSWTPGTKGTVTADVLSVQIDSEADFEKYRGKLAGKIVLTQPERPVPMLEGLIVHRMSEKDFEEAATTPIPQPRGGGRRGRAAADPPDDDPTAGGRGGRGGMLSLTAKIAQFYKAEGVVATFNRGSDNIMASIGSNLSAQQQHTDGGTIFPTGNGSRGADAGTGLPSVTLAVEHYNRMVRVLAKGIPVKVELNIDTKFYDEATPNGFNTIAEIPGTDPKLKDEVVMLGALTARGAIVGAEGIKGRTVKVHVKIDGGQIEDVLRLAIKGNTPVMTGQLRLHADLNLPAGPDDVMERLELGGEFDIGGARFTDASVQARLSDLSERARGLDPKESSRQVASNLRGQFRLARSVLSLHDATFGIPGATARVAGRYGLSNESLEFDGTVRMHATVSQAAGGGVKSVLLKVVDPLFRKDGAGAVLPIRIRGSRNEPKFGLDFRRALRRE